MNTPPEKLEILQRVYADPANGFPGTSRLYELVRKKGITLKQVKDFLKNNDTAQLYKQQKKIKNIPIEAPDDSYQCDLAFYTQYKKQNGGFHVLLCLIEITSRKAYVYPLKNKNREEIIRGLEQFFQDVTRPVLRLYTDPGSEFKSKEFKALMDEQLCDHVMYQSKEHNELGIVDRFIRTLRERIEKLMDDRDERKYVKQLPSIVKGYNATPHSSLSGLTPDEVFDSDVAREIIHDEKAIIKADALSSHTDLKPGTLVRLAVDKGLFEKGTKRKFSKEVFEILETVGYKYRLMDEDGNIQERLQSRRKLLPVPEGAKNMRAGRKIELFEEQKRKQVNRIKKAGVVTTRVEAEALVEKEPTAKTKREPKTRKIVVDDGINKETGRRYQGRERLDFSKRSFQEILDDLKPKSRAQRASARAASKQP